MLRTLIEDRKQRQLDLQNIEQEKQKLDQQKRLIEKAQHDLEIKESKFVRYEPLIPSVKELMDMGITFDLILPYIETIREKVVLENIDSSRAAYNLTLELRNYRQLGGMERAIELAKQQLAAIDMFALNRQNAFTTLFNLQRIGINEKEIIELANIVHRWNNQNVICAQNRATTR